MYEQNKIWRLIHFAFSPVFVFSGSGEFQKWLFITILTVQSWYVCSICIGCGHDYLHLPALLVKWSLINKKNNKKMK